MAAEILSQTIDPTVDFVGHVGGDDFVVVFVSHDWNCGCNTVLSRFEEAIPSHFIDRTLGSRGNFDEEPAR